MMRRSSGRRWWKRKEGARSSSRCGYGCGSLLAQARDSFRGVARCAETFRAATPACACLWPPEAPARASRCCSTYTSAAPHLELCFEVADEACFGFWCSRNLSRRMMTCPFYVHPFAIFKLANFIWFIEG